MMHDTRASIRKFLGAEALELGPFGLLSVWPRDCTAASVESALQQQLDRVSAHPEGDTPEADEVRLALHSAAAQLLDPRVREHLANRWRDEAARREHAASQARSRPAPAKAPAAPAAQPAAPVSPTIIEPRAKRRGSDDAAKLIVGAAVLTVAVIGLVIAAIIVFAVVPAPAPLAGGGGTSGGPILPPAAPAETAAADTGEPDLAQAASNATPIGQAPPPPGAAGGPVLPRTAFVDPRRTLKDLRDAAAAARTNPSSALDSLRPVLRQLGDWWAAYEPGVRRACDDALVEVIYALSASTETQAELHTLIAAPSLCLGPAEGPDPRPRLQADEAWPAAWSVGMLTRLTRERELSTRLAAKNAAALDAALGRNRPTLDSTFESGVGVALRRMPQLLLTDPASRSPGRESVSGPAGSTAAVKRWIEACAAFAVDENTLERLLCDGLEQILISSKDPEEDLGVFEAIGAIAQSIKWRAGGPARPRLLDWFRDPRVSESDVRVVTAAIAGKSGAEGVDPTMILSVSPGPDGRSRLRARYAQAWSIESMGGERASDVWLTAARTLLDAPPVKGQVDPLRDAAACARLNEAARLLWRGERNGADSLMREAAVVQDFGVISTPKGPAQTKLMFHLTGGGPDGSWAERYLAAERSIPARLQLLAELDRMGRPVGSVDASILVQEAVIGSPIQVRFAAARLAGLWADEVTIVLAALDELPLAPRTRSAADMMERITRQTLPPLTDPDWELAVRRALVERLLAMLAGGTVESSLEQYASLISDSYLRAAGQETAQGAGAAAEGAQRGAELLWTAIRAEADAVAPVPAAPIPLDQIDRRRIGRRTLATGPVQAFAAEQVSVAEAMSYVVAGEKPTSAKRVEAIVARMQTARRAASHVFDQILATERAILELWMLRFDQEPGGAG